MATFKAQRAYALHGKGDLAGAKKCYQEAVDAGMNVPRYLLSYALLLVREGSYQQAKDILLKTQKAPGLTAEQKVQMFIDYAACCFRLGDIDKGVDLLERQHQKATSGLVYQTLGYLYVEKFLPERRPVLTMADLGELPEDADAEAALAKAQSESDARWQEGSQAALQFNQDAVEYDDEDSVCLDNLAQFYYRVLGDKATAKEWFDKAIAIKPRQIDTLWFLSRYDIEAGNNDAAIEKLTTAAEGRFSPLNYCTKENIEKEISRLKA